MARISDTPVISAALAAVARGWHVFPCAGKEPRPRWRWAEWNTADPAKARQWLADAAAYGIACGPSGLVVADLDMPKAGQSLPAGWAGQPGIGDGRDVFAALCELAGSPWPDTYTVATPSGGWHLYFTADPGRRVTVSVGNGGGVAPMVDIRGDGGYVVGPGSIIGGRVYEAFNDGPAAPLPGWLAGLCERAATTTPTSRRPPEASHANGYAAAALVSEAAIVAAAPEGTRNHQLNKSAYTLARLPGLDAGTITAGLTDAARRAGLSDTEIERTIRSALSARGRGNDR